MRLTVTRYIPGRVANNPEEFAERSRSIIRRMQNTALVYGQQLRMLRLKRLSPDELVQIYSYLLNLERSLMTRKAAPAEHTPKRLGRVHIGLEGDYLRIGKRYCQVLSAVEPPRGTRPDLLGRSIVGRLRNRVLFSLATPAKCTYAP